MYTFIINNVNTVWIFDHIYCFKLFTVLEYTNHLLDIVAICKLCDKRITWLWVSMQEQCGDRSEKSLIECIPFIIVRNIAEVNGVLLIE